MLTRTLQNTHIIYMYIYIYIYIQLYNMYIPAISTDIHGWQITSYKFIDTLVKGYTSWLLNQGLQRMFQAQPAFSNIPSTMGTRTGSVHTLNSSSKPWSFYVDNPCDRVGKIGNHQSVKCYINVSLGAFIHPVSHYLHVLSPSVQGFVGDVFPNPFHFLYGFVAWLVQSDLTWSSLYPITLRSLNLSNDQRVHHQQKKGHKELCSWVLSKCLWS